MIEADLLLAQLKFIQLVDCKRS